jgi:hypothetical protein
MYHRIVRTNLMVVAFLLLFDGGFVFPITKELSESTYRYLGSSAVGVYVGVAETEINTLSAELQARSKELDEREAALQAREIAPREFGTFSQSEYSTYILSVILFVLTVLVLLNYVLDWRRNRIQTV